MQCVLELGIDPNSVNRGAHGACDRYGRESVNGPRKRCIEEDAWRQPRCIVSYPRRFSSALKATDQIQVMLVTWRGVNRNARKYVC
jgi:hypothetical protein